MTPTWAVKVMTGWQQTHEDQSALDAEMATWATVAQCHAEFNQKITPWQELIRSFPEERFRETQWLPFNGGREHTYLEMMEFPRWNLTYHLGQIAYIQTLYGDREMH